MHGWMDGRMSIYGIMTTLFVLSFAVCLPGSGASPATPRTPRGPSPSWRRECCWIQGSSGASRAGVQEERAAVRVGRMHEAKFGDCAFLCARSPQAETRRVAKSSFLKLSQCRACCSSDRTAKAKRKGRTRAKRAQRRRAKGKARRARARAKAKAKAWRAKAAGVAMPRSCFVW